MVEPLQRRRQYGEPYSIREENLAQEAQEEEMQERADSTSFGDALGAAFKKNSLFNVTAENMERASFEPQAGYRVPSEELKSLTSELDDDELEFIAGAVSPEDYASRKDKLAKDKEMHQTVRDAGLKGMGADILAYMLDPATLPLMVATGGIAGAGKAALGARVLRASSVGAGEAGAIEAALASTDTQRDWTDVALATVAGGVVSGAMPAIGAGVRRLRGVDEIPSAPLDDARAVDEQLRLDTERAQLGAISDELQAGMGFRNLTSVDRRATLVDELLPTAQARLPGKQRKAVNATAQKARQQLDDLDAERKALPQLSSKLKGNRLKRATAERARVLDDIAARASRAQDQLDNAVRRQTENKAAQEAQAAIESIQRGEIPPQLKQRYAEILEQEKTPFVRAESQRVRKMAEDLKQTKAAKADVEAEARAKGLDEPSTTVDKPDSTAGAQQVKGAEFWEDTYKVPEEGDLVDQVVDAARLGSETPRAWQNRLLGTKATREALQSTYATVDQSVSDVIRGLNVKLNNDAQGLNRGNIPAAVYQDMYMRRFLNAEGGREVEAVEAYAKSKGVNPIKAVLNMGGAREEFDNLVVLHMRGKQVSTDANVIKAAEARAATLEEALRARKDSGVLGYESVKSDKRYWPFLPSIHKMQHAIANPKYGRKAVEDLMTKSYQQGRFKLSEKSARIVANAQIERTMNRGLAAKQKLDSLLDSKNRQLLEDDLKTAGMDPDTVKRILDDMAEITEREGVGARARMSLGASMSQTDTATGLRMVDILDTSQEASLGYAREAAGDSSLARQGFTTRRAADDTIALAEKEAKNLLDDEMQSAVKAGNQKEIKRIEDARRQVSEDVGRLRDSVRMLYSESLDANAEGKISNAVKVSRGVRKYTGVIRLGWNGFASIAENSNAIVNFGMGTVLRNIPQTKMFRYGTPKADEALDEMYRVMGAYGHKDSYIINKNQMANNLSEDAQGRLEKIYNNGVGWVADKTMALSGFRTVQNGGEELAMRSMMDRLMRAAQGKLKYRDADMEHWRQAGLTDTDVDAIFKHINDNPTYIDIGGKQTQIFSGEGMDPALRDRMGAAMTSLLSRNMQKNFVGDTSIWVNKELGKLVTQFRTFSLVSMEKQLIAGLRGDKIALAQKLMWGSLLAYGAYNTRIGLQATTKAPEDREQFIKNSTTGAALGIGVLNMTSQTGGFGIPLDGLATFGALPDEWMQGAKRWGFRGYGVDSVPAVGVVSDAAGAVTGGVQFMKSVMTGENMEDEDAQRAAKSMYRLLPLVNTAAVGSAMAVAND